MAQIIAQVITETENRINARLAEIEYLLSANPAKELMDMRAQFKEKTVGKKIVDLTRDADFQAFLSACTEKEAILEDLMQRQSQPGYSSALVHEKVDLQNQLVQLDMLERKLEK